MECRVESKDEFSVYGMERVFTTEDDKMLKDIPAFWGECWESGRCSALLESANGQASGVHAICGYRETGTNTFPYMIFTHRTEKSDTKGFTEVCVPAATWAIFKSEKHTMEQTAPVVQSLIKRIYVEWLPNASYKKVDGYELELCFCAGDGMFYSEVWIRVESK